MAGRLKLELLGGCRLTLDGQVLDVRFAKSRALLCYLAVTGGPHSRGALTDLLWGESSEGDARANLRVRLSGLRRALPDVLTVTRDAVAFNRESFYELDVEQFQAILRTQGDFAGLRAAVRLYKGDFLEGFHVPGALAFETWLMGRREKLRGLVLDALWRLASHHAERGEYGQARDDLLHFLSLDPWREDAHRQLMGVFAQSGQREAAVAQYLACCRVLTEELGLEPTPETTQLYEQIRAGAPRPPIPRPPQPVAARRQLTVMSCELTGVGALTDPEELHERIDGYHRRCADAIARFGGFVAQRQGPSVVAYFGFPLAHEDDARRAVGAGLELLELLAARIGIQTGMVVVTVREGGPPEVVGLTPVAAQRLQALAKDGEVLVGGATERLARGFFATDNLGSQLLDGLAEPLEVHRVLGETAARSRLQAAPPRTGLVGRTGELAALLRCWKQARAGRRRAVLISGEAGIGKSRLLYALKKQLEHAPPRWLEAHSAASLTNSPFAPLVALIERELGFAAQDTPEDKLGKLEAALGRIGLTVSEALPPLAALLGLPHRHRHAAPDLSSERQRQETLDILVRWLLLEAARGPLVFVLEDAHWCDPSTLDVIGRLMESAGGTRLLMVLTARPEGSAARARPGEFHHIELASLSSHDTAALIAQLSAETPLPPDVLRILQERSDGIPLYIEELTRGVLESGWPDAGQHGPTTIPGTLIPETLIPGTLQDALTARLDRLGEAREVAQLASVIGRTFSLDVLAAAFPAPEPALERSLDQLVSVGLIEYEAGERQYSFRHALIQDAAYGSLVRRDRQSYHARVAGVLSEHFAEVAQRQPELLAQHYTAAGLVAEAVPLWQQAAVRALARSAHQEAARLFHAALQALTDLPETPGGRGQELDVLLGLGAALQSARGYADPEVEAVYRRALALCQTATESPRLFAALLGLAGHFLMRAQYRTAGELVNRMFALRLLSPLQSGQLHCMASRLTALQGQFDTSLSHSASVLRLPDPPRSGSKELANLAAQEAKASALGFSAFVLWLAGSPDQALANIERGLRYADHIGSLYMKAAALSNHVGLRFMRRQPQEAQPPLAAFMTLATEQRFTHWLPYGQIYQGALQVRAGRLEGLTLAREGLDRFEELGVVTHRPFLLGVFAEAQRQAGQLELALQTVQGALAQVEETGERWWEAELHRLGGDLLLEMNNWDEGEASLRKALAVARGQEAKSLELRASLSLARQLREQGKAQEARAMLTEIHAWFTEGFDTPDLQEADRALTLRARPNLEAAIRQ